MSEEVRVTHVLCESLESAADVWSRVMHGEDIGQIARRQSLCPSGAQLGDLGFFKKGVMEKIFEQASFSLEVGEISQPVLTQFGWHIIKRTG